MRTNSAGTNATRMTQVKVWSFYLILLVMGSRNVAAQQQASPPPSKFKLTTSAYSDDQWIPVQYTCGASDSYVPGLQWTDAPQGTASFAVILHDTDAAPGKG